MKKVFVSICVAGAALAMSSCRSVEKSMARKLLRAKVEPFRLLHLIRLPVVCPVIADVTV